MKLILKNDTLNFHLDNSFLGAVHLATNLMASDHKIKSLQNTKSIGASQLQHNTFLAREGLYYTHVYMRISFFTDTSIWEKLLLKF